MRAVARSRWAVCAAFALGIGPLACVGDIGGAGHAGGTEPVPGLECARAGRSVIRRLTKTELSNTVRDLFGVSSAPLAELPEEQLGASGFDTDSQALDMSSQLLDQYLTATEAVAADVIANTAFVSCQPSAQCAQQVLEEQLPRIYRGPVTPDDVADLMAVFSTNEQDGFPIAMQLVLQAALLSPHFLYRTFREPDPSNPAELYTLDGYELASQLSYFLWSSMPDDALIAKAAAGTLSQPDVLEAEVRRMLADPKGLALIDAFSSQWLGLGQLATATRDPALYPAWTPALAQAMAEETRTFMRSLLTEDKTPLELLTADYSYLDGTLAAHYGIGGVSGEMQRVDLPADSHRIGLLTQGSFLALTSTAERSNPIRRGKWVLLQALCAELPPKPGGVPPLVDTGDAEGSVRDELAAHRTNPACAGCHTMMDPIGLGLEQFDAIGAFRETYRDGSPIDPSGELPGGATFDDVPGLVADLIEGGDFNRCITRRLLSYAVSRNLTSNDQCVSDGIAEAAVSVDKSFSDLVLAIVASAPFRKREGAAQ